jgi:hypothetical protein
VKGMGARKMCHLCRRASVHMSSALVCALMVVAVSPAAAIELRRERLIIDFPSPPSMGEAVDRTAMGPINRFAAVAVTPQCDYALFEFRYPRQYVEAMGDGGVLPQAVRESVARYGGQVHSLERGLRGGTPLVDVGFTIRGKKGQGTARYLQVDDTVFEAAVLCTPGAPTDPQFLRSIRIP